MLAALWVVAGPVLSLMLRPPPARARGRQPHARVAGLAPPPAQRAAVVGYYPAAVWLAYLLAGMAIGRTDLLRKGVDLVLLAGGAGLAVAATAVSRALLSRADAWAALAATYPDQGGRRTRSSWPRS